jgi:hypothetical protein
MHVSQLRAAALMLLSIPLIGCLSLAQVQKLAQTTDAAKASASTIAGDKVIAGPTLIPETAVMHKYSIHEANQWLPLQVPLRVGEWARRCSSYLE